MRSRKSEEEEEVKPSTSGGAGIKIPCEVRR